MKHQPLPPFPSRRRKISVEVYFVLYLSAIVLLLGTASTRRSSDREAELEEAIVQMLAPDFRLDVEKVALIYRFLPAGLAADTSGIRLTRDSINTIRARGSFSEVEFGIIAIEDTSTGQQLPIESATLARQSERSAVFTWRPREAIENAVYRVTVAASATPLPPSNIARPEIRDRISEILRRHRVGDTVAFTVNVFAVNNLAMLRDPQLPPTNLRGDSGLRAAMPAETVRTFIQPGEIIQPGDFSPVQPSVRAVPRGSWENKIIAPGVSNPRIVKGGNARITSISPGIIKVQGVAPATGTLEVVIEGVRSDGRTVTTNFVVSTTPLDSPTLPQSFYPEMVYNLDFSSDDVPSNAISVDVELNGRKIKDHRNVSAKFSITPEAIGTLVFTRYVGDQEYDKFTREVVPLQRPIVGKPEFRRNGEEAIVTTTSYGYVKGEKNLARLIVDVGNADDPELLRTETDDSGMIHTQTWRIERRDPKNDFSFTIHAIDQRGSGAGKSDLSRYLQP